MLAEYIVIEMLLDLPGTFQDTTHHPALSSYSRSLLFMKLCEWV